VSTRRGPALAGFRCDGGGERGVAAVLL